MKTNALNFLFFFACSCQIFCYVKISTLKVILCTVITDRQGSTNSVDPGQPPHDATVDAS